ncbi:histidine kinase [Dyadobacter flavalbus]|uniref:Histidine kinase n=1 Tax=Dyadobacter flavalbus TaxID=2579942 RepID=A0A5M8QUN5_9BACT|nr:histidine kinase [Dyadobacter flavalbus]KAA6438544.1 histidine kinase [Dyadobacter flavalbus]
MPFSSIQEQFFVRRLSKAYRYILDQRDMALVPIKVELDFIDSYTFLLQMRFEGKFHVNGSGGKFHPSTNAY